MEWGDRHAGRGSWASTTSSHPGLPSDVPSSPQLLTIVDVSHNSVTVSWEPPEKLGRLGLQGYVLELRREGGELDSALHVSRGGGAGCSGSRDSAEGESASRDFLSTPHLATLALLGPLKVEGCPVTSEAPLSSSSLELLNYMRVGNTGHHSDERRRRYEVSKEPAQGGQDRKEGTGMLQSGNNRQ